MIAQLVSRRDYFSTHFEISFKFRANDKERRFDALFVESGKNFFGRVGKRAVVESQGDDLLPSVYARNDLAEELKSSRLADLVCGGGHGYDYDDGYQDGLRPFIDHLLSMDVDGVTIRRGRYYYRAFPRSRRSPTHDVRRDSIQINPQSDGRVPGQLHAFAQRLSGLRFRQELVPLLLCARDAAAERCGAYAGRIAAGQDERPRIA